MANVDFYLHHLRSQVADILCIDLGTNDLCGEDVTPRLLADNVVKFLDLLQLSRIAPQRIILFSVIQRSAITRRGQVNLTTFNHRARRFNSLLNRRISYNHNFIIFLGIKMTLRMCWTYLILIVYHLQCICLFKKEKKSQLTMADVNSNVYRWLGENFKGFS